MILIALIFALLPAVLLWIYVWKKDPHKEPTLGLVKSVVLGAVICIPVAFWEIGIELILYGGEESTSLIGSTFQAFFVAAIPEECAKLFVLWLILRKNPAYDEHFDGIVYAVCVGLGFAAVENVFYVIGDDDWIFVAFSRALLAVPGHYAFAVLMGYYYSVYHFVDHSSKTAACVLLVPIAAHGVYDALAMSGAVNPYVGIISFIVLIVFCIKMHKVAKAKIFTLIEKDIL